LARWVPRLLSDQQKSRNRRKVGPVVLDCPTTPAVQPGPLPCDYHMFGPLKEALGGLRFDDDEQVENFVHNWLQTRPPSFYDAGLKNSQSSGKNA